MADWKRLPVVVFIIPAGRIPKGDAEPQFELYRIVDVAQLVGSGACFGAALTGLIVMLVRPRR